MKLIFKYRLLFFVIIFVQNSFAKVLIISHHFNRPDFIELQHKTFKKFLKDEYEFVVFNDAERNPGMYSLIEQTCAKLNIRSITINQAIHDMPYLQRSSHKNWNSPSVRTSNAVQYSLDVLGFDHDGLVVIIDSDMFLVKDFSIEEYLKSFNIAAIPESRGHVNYLWNGIVFLDMHSLPSRRTMNWNTGYVEGQLCDTGGYTYFYLQQHPELKLKYINCEYFREMNTNVLSRYGFTQNEMNFLQSDDYGAQLLLDQHFLHYRAGGNWMGQSTAYHAQKSTIFNGFINRMLQK